LKVESINAENMYLNKTLSLFLVLLMMLVGLASAFDGSKLQSSLIAKYGSGAVSNFTAWQSMMDVVKDKSSDDKIKRVNEFFNRRITWGDDQAIWSQLDYWATPIDTLGRGMGDCEDFAIAKYYTLVNLGIPVAKLRLVYVKAKNGNGTSGGEQAHMVLAYYPSPESEPMIMDNMITDIRPASRRPDLMPVFSFNSEGIYTGAGGQAGQAENTRLSKWQDLLQRAGAEGFN
jgi:predicted transglutaminase-like cysteine proteinase